MVFRKKSIVLSLCLITLSLSACGGGTPTTSTSPAASPGASPGASAGVTVNKPDLQGNAQLTGAGATFPAPLYQNWFVLLNNEIPDLQVNYQAVGSGAGVQQFTTGTVDFGASDVAMTDKQIKAVPRGVLMLPMTAGSIVLAYNLPGVEKLNLSQETYANIFLGKITKWNDPAIVKDNPNIKLPDMPIVVVHRSDGSGTTEVFTSNLSAMSADWKSTIGTGKTVQWPKGKFIGSKGNDGVTASIKQNEGSIGYVEYGFAKNNKVSMAALANKAGKFITPNEESASASLANVELPENLRAFIVNPDGENSYPFVTYSWLLIYKKYDDPKKAIAVKAMIDFGLNKGQEQSAALGYIPIPKKVRERVAEAANVISKDFTIKVQ